MLEIKKILLNTGFFEDNQYLDEYVELIVNNLTTVRATGTTQEHHIIPIFCYSTDDIATRVGGYHTSAASRRRRDLTKLANADSNNKRVHLKFSDHLKAHILLTKCGKSYGFILQNANACTLMLNLIRKAVDQNVVPDLNSDDNIQKAYNYIIDIRRKPKDDPEFYQKVVKNLKRGGADKKVKCLETGVVYNSLKEAEDANNLTRYRLNQILTGRRKQIPGMTFEYYSETSAISEASI
jgi:hypothetical protein